LQPLPDHARPPQFSPPPLIFYAVGCALHVTSSLLCPQAAEQEYDQAILMLPVAGFSKQIRPTQIAPEDCCLPAQLNSPFYRNLKYPN
jgi:hypothetical protein